MERRTDVERSADEIGLVVTRDELHMLYAAVRETLEAVEDWEFSARSGFTKTEFRGLQASLDAVVEQLPPTG